MKTLEELDTIRQTTRANLQLRHPETYQTKVVVGMGTSGILSGAREVLKTLMEEIAIRQLGTVMVTQVDDVNLKDEEPFVEVWAGDNLTTYVHLNEEKMRRIVKEHLVEGHIVDEFVKQ